MYVPSIFNKDHIYMSGFESACSHHCTLAVYGSSTDDFANLLQMEAWKCIYHRGCRYYFAQWGLNQRPKLLWSRIRTFIKFRFSKEAAKIWQNFPVSPWCCSDCQRKLRVFYQISLDNLNFTSATSQDDFFQISQILIPQEIYKNKTTTSKRISQNCTATAVALWS